MAMTKKSSQDHLAASFGQIDEAIRSRTGNDVLLVGGVMEGTATAVEHGDAAMMHFDANQNLMVNVVEGEIVASLGTVGVVEAGTITKVSSVANLVSGTVARVTEVANLAAGTITSVGNLVGGTVGVVSSVANLAGGTIGVVGSVSNLADGTVAVVSSVSNLAAGTISVLNNGTVASNQVSVTRGTVTIVSDNTYKAGTTTVELNGLMRGLTFVTPDMEDTDSTDLSLYDSYGYLVHSSGTVAELGTTTVYFGGTALDRPLFGVTTLIATAEGTQSAARDVVFTIKATR